MRKDQIASFVTEILNAGASLHAADDIYFFGDLVVEDERAIEIWAEVNRICERYGWRDHLRREIACHLKRLGRVVNIDGESLVLSATRRSAASTSALTVRERFANCAGPSSVLSADRTSRLH